MATLTTGLFIVTRHRPVVEAPNDAPFRVTLCVFDRQGPRAVENYRVTWQGEEARAWWQAHGEHVTSGTPLRLTLENPRSFPHIATGSEIHAAVRSCELAPLPPSHAHHAHPPQVAA